MEVLAYRLYAYQFTYHTTYIYSGIACQCPKDRVQGGDTRMLSGKRILVSGVATGESIAAAVAEKALSLGAEIIVAAYPRHAATAEETVRSFSGLSEVPVLPLDATSESDLLRLETEIQERWGYLDGALHAIAFAPQAALDAIMGVPSSDVEMAIRSSVWTYSAFGRLLYNLAPSSGASLVGLDFDSSKVWPVYNWMGPCKAALRSLNGYLARDLGEKRIRANLVAAGPIHTRASSGIPSFNVLVDAWNCQSVLNWDPTDTHAVADSVCFLLSDFAQSISGEVLHVDGGVHAMATHLRELPGS